MMSVVREKDLAMLAWRRSEQYVQDSLAGGQRNVQVYKLRDKTRSTALLLLASFLRKFHSRFCHTNACDNSRLEEVPGVIYFRQGISCQYFRGLKSDSPPVIRSQRSRSVTIARRAAGERKTINDDASRENE